MACHIRGESPLIRLAKKLNLIDGEGLNLDFNALPSLSPSPGGVKGAFYRSAKPKKRPALLVCSYIYTNRNNEILKIRSKNG